MSIAEPLTQPKEREVAAQPRINDFVIHVATVNGSGSQSANTALLRAIMQMGIPVSGKNLFPSNIQGLPTWFTIRVNKDGYLARKDHVDVLVAMNPETAHSDVMKVTSGAVVVYDQPLKLDSLRDDLTFYAVPFNDLVKPVVDLPKLRKLVRNIIYDGVLAWLLGIEMESLEEAIRKQFKRKPKAAELNIKAARVGYEYAKDNLPPQKKFRLERMNKTANKILIDGNGAAALGCMFAGVQVITWYPITPSSSLAEQLSDYMTRYRMDPESGKATFAILQAEDELAAIGMVLGAGWAGARAMTATSGPGISLMAEFAGLAYYAEVPGVIFDVQRVGPSTGMPTRSMQGDTLFVALLSHGDTQHIMLFPNSPEEIFDMSIEAFDLAEHLQTLIFVMSDLDLGMNMWMANPFQYPQKPMNRGKVLSAEDLEKIQEWGRYKDIDGDGIPYRTLPGTHHPKAPYFTRGSGHTEYARYTEDPVEFTKVLARIKKKYDKARDILPAPAIDRKPNAKIAFISYGTSHWPVEESRDVLRSEYGIETSYLRIRAYPFSKQVQEFIDAHDRVYVVEQNRDAQMLKLMRMEFTPEQIAKLRSIHSYDGLPMSSEFLVNHFLEQENA
ncbi:MAG: 2-oxoacid:acceptor oxidoreductase subunit alpha [candidate division KSB1 bacterium]|nr:2-oxoacid:acceptor oxidoreductase subunit alpha [candidate division KSB1 bacterium]MDQ7065083.1 2-oxoacid:acceptor oxidoreductase subunit alpha [candidate division KSB1 bacterium]